MIGISALIESPDKNLVSLMLGFAFILDVVPQPFFLSRTAASDTLIHLRFDIDFKLSLQPLLLY
jgi:hypothetical protein